MKRMIASFSLLMGLTACAGPGGVGPGGGLMYRVPESPTVVYLTADTSSIDFDAGAMGTFRMRSTGTSTMDVSFARGEEGVQVTATFRELNARLSQPMGGAQTATAADVGGDIVFNLDARGHATTVSMPEVKAGTRQLLDPEAVAYEFFPLLPGGPVSPGESWTDTLSYEVQSNQGDSETRTVMTYTLEGDTVVDGRTLLHISVTGTTDVTMSWVQEGMEVLPTLSGDIEGTVLWDPDQSLYVSGVFETDMNGTFEVPEVGMPPMPLTRTGRSYVRLQGS